MSDIFDHALDAFDSEMDQLEEGLSFEGGLFEDDEIDEEEQF